MQNIITTPGFDTSILKGQLSPSSLKMYERDFQAYLAFAQNKEQALNPSTLAQWRIALVNENKSPNTINRMISTVKSLMVEAAAQGMISYELAERFKYVKGVKVEAMKEQIKEKTWLEPEEVRALCEAPGTASLKGLRDTALLHCIASSGLRASEVAVLKLSQIKLQGREYVILVQGKNETELSEACVSKEAVEAIQRWIAARPIQSEYIFTGFGGRGETRLLEGPMAPRSVWLVVKESAEKAGIDGRIYTHALRAFVGDQINERYDLGKAQAALRHKDPGTTAKHYIRKKAPVGITNNLY